MSSALEKNGLKCLNAVLPDDFEAKLVSDQGRIYYLNHAHQTSSWVPPRENWDPGTAALPYGWEGAQDRNQKPYYINHMERYTTREDPRNDPDYVAPPKPREVELQRDAQKGFGFVAGSEKPVVVRFVTDGGPSVDKLMPGDQIIKINGQDVKKAPREFVIDLVRSCKQTISLTVCQPYNDSCRRSALLTAAKKDKLKKNPSRVRFSEDVDVRRVSLPTDSIATEDSTYVPFIPNVLKVFLENGQTKSFKYDNKTTVKDVVNSIQEKLSIKDVVHFNLVLHNMKSLMPGRMTLLQDHETVSEIASRPGARHFRCLFRVMYVPRDSYDLLKHDPIAFEYFYIQCVNDVLQDRFTTELKQETLMRLSALHIQQHAMSNNITGKINIKSIEKEFGLEKFVPQSIREAFKIKDLRKVLAQCLKMNANLTAPGQKQLTALQAKLHYMKIVSELKTFGSRVFMVTLLDKKTEAMILVGPKSGISLVTNVRSYTDYVRATKSELSMLADFSEVQCIKVSKETHDMRRVEITIKGEEPGTLNLGLLKEDATNFVCMVNGYYRIFVDNEGNVIQKNAGKQSVDPDIPQFESKHIVLAAPWSYPEDIVSMVIDEGKEGGDNQRVIDLSRGPPAYEGDKKFIMQLKKDLGLPDIAESQESESTADKEGFSEDVGSPSPTTPVSTNLTSLTAEEPATTKDVNDNNETERVNFNSPNLPQKTVIMIESPPNSMNASVTSATDSQASTKMDSDSVSSASTSSLSQNGTNSTNSDAEPSPTLPKKVYSSPVMKSRKRHQPAQEEDHAEYVNSPRADDNNVKPSDFVHLTGKASNEPVEYINIRQTKKFEVGSSSSDTDSGMGGDSERTTFSAEDGRGYGQEAEPDRRIGSWLQQRRPTVDLTPLLDLGYMHRAGPRHDSPSSTSSLDPDSSFLGPFNADQLPLEIQNAVYDSRLFSDKEMRVDPDIIDLTLLPPFPPTEEELEEESRLGSSHRHSHPPLSKQSTVPFENLDDVDYLKPHLMKSHSVGYTPDFLDNDIDAIIEQLIVQPPPTDSSLEQVNIDQLGTSWNGPVPSSYENGYDNQHLSRTIDLGELGLDDQYSSLVIPPPPDTSSTLDNIVIVPPVESVKEKKKKFENSDSDGYLKSFGKKSSVLRLHPKKDAVNDNDFSQKPEPKVNSTDDSGNGVVNGENANDTSPASVSEKLNALLASLSSYSQQEEEAVGVFRRTSSLRLGRCASLDFLNEPKKVESCDKTSDLVTGSVRVKPKVRPKLSIERPYLSGSGHVPVPLKTGPVEQMNNDQVEKSISHIKTSSNFTRTRSVDVLPTMSEKADAEASVSESFASLKAKLQSYRDSLLNRSLRRKKKLQDQNQKSESESDQISGEGEKVQRKNSLTRSNSFTSLLRRSLGKSSGKEVQSEMKAEEDKDDGKSAGKDKKYFNTLTTPRTNFRPNTGSSQAQDDFYIDIMEDTEYFEERLAPKPPLPTCNTPHDKGESRAQKAGPIKALSSVFDRADSDPNILTVPVVPIREKSPKRKAPHAPPTGDQITVAQAATNPSVARELGGTKEFTSSVMSSMTSSGIPSASSTKPVMLSKPLTIPTAPPRRKHLLSNSEHAQSPVTDQTSKDDSTIELSSPAKTNVKASPFSTVGKMWRPMSMSTSATNDKEETHYQTFNNFDVLREMGTEKLPLTASPRDQVEPVKINGHGHLKAVVSKTTSRANKVLTGNGSVSEKSFAVLKEKVSASHSNTVKQILDTVYTSEDFVQATGDVEKLLNELKQTMESLKSSRIDKKPVQFDMCKDELQSQVRQFVTDAKLLVSNATQTREKLAVNMDSSMHSLAKIFLHGQATMFMMEAIHQAQHLGSEVMRVANAYKSTLNAAHAAVGKPLADPHMKYLMRQATNLATLLSTLLKSLKTLEQK
ncbi:uncharacterized protein LOC127876023 isoform X3 [Dreissena polymorpha]|uniref:uncharacterized protein LOC127876023 isoform X3 n=1 Tax=Dreissena polymorpha TaxID=45954 RepID=UPI002264EDF5|nr:uncharacterized protein LOC127876023 isoform X3 [Dreissena polymorpha]